MVEQQADQCQARRPRICPVAGRTAGTAIIDPTLEGSWQTQFLNLPLAAVLIQRTPFGLPSRMSLRDASYAISIEPLKTSVRAAVRALTLCGPTRSRLLYH
jgi:hypothetical protein